MKHEIKVPAMGESISEAVVSLIIKPAGSYVKVDDEIIELATDKVNQVLYATAAGVFNPLVKVDDHVKIGDLIGIIDDSAQLAPSQEREQEKPLKAASENKVANKEAKQAPFATESGQKVDEARAKDAQQKEQAFDASAAFGARVPLQKFVEEMKHSDEQNMFKEQQAKESLPKEDPRLLAPFSAPQEDVRRKMSPIRKVIASRLVSVQHESAMLTTFNEVDLSAVMALRQRYKEFFAKEYGTKLGLMSFFVKASVEALKKYPAINSYIDKEDIVERKSFSIGVAVGTDKGVVVPVLKNCHALSFAEIEKAIAYYATAIKEGKIKADDLQGAGFTITNGGTYGSLLSTPIISPKQCAILGMHKIEKRPVVVEDAIVIREMMYLALSYDHRIVDGKEAVSFLVYIKSLLEDPARMLLEWKL